MAKLNPSPERTYVIPQKEVFKKMLHKISCGLGREDIAAIVFHRSLSDEMKTTSSLEVLDNLYRRGEFNHNKVGPLIDLLKVINRNDLVHSIEDDRKEISELACLFRQRVYSIQV